MISLRTLCRPFDQLNAHQIVVPSVRSVYKDSKEIEYLPYERRQFCRRYGYKGKVWTHGVLPRLQKEEGVLPTMPDKNHRPDPWHKREARFGENDYIDILGESQDHPITYRTEIPWWLRGWRGSEMSMLQRQAHAEIHMKVKRPETWHYLQKRINYLHRFMNTHSQPPKLQKYLSKF